MALVRRLSGSDVPAVLKLLATDPVANVFLEHRIRTVPLGSPWFGGCVYGYFEDGGLIAVCHAATNVIPAGAMSPAVLDAFAAEVRGHRTASIVGYREDVMGLWQRLEEHWGPARSVRSSQPLLQIEAEPHCDSDNRVRAVLIDEFDTIYPSCVAMFREEVGADPEADSPGAYRARVADLITQGWAFAIIENGDVVFKAEVGAATSQVCQLQGVYVAPALRGSGIAAPALAAVIRQIQGRIAPVVTLYVNDFNLAARRAYSRVGFEQIGTFATVLL